MRRALPIAATAAALLLAAPAAQALDRPEYKDAVEPICKTNTEANERILKGVEGLVKRGKLKPAANKFSKAGTALKKAHRQLSAVPRPEADEARLTKWLSFVKTEADLFDRIAAKLRASKKGQASRLSSKLTTNANQANAQVLAFGFRYCRFEPSKFT